MLDAYLRYYNEERPKEKLRWLQIQIDPLVEGYGVAVATGLPVAGHAGLHQQPLTLVVVVGCHFVRQRGARAHDARPFCQDEKQDYLQKCSDWITELPATWSLNLQTFAAHSDRHRR